jgi:rhamnosyltransferase
MQSCTGAVVVALYGATPEGLWSRLLAYSTAGLLVVAVNNNAPGFAKPRFREWRTPLVWLENQNQGGLARALNRGVAEAARLDCAVITLLDQDSVLHADGVLQLQTKARTCEACVVGPAIWDLERQTWHTKTTRPRMLITSGTTFTETTWKLCGPYREWMEIDFIDHEWCSRARERGMELHVESQVTLKQHFGERHPNPVAHRLGLQLYSPYRRAIALRNLRWLIYQRHVPLDIRFKESLKMLLKPLLWLALEPRRSQTLRCLKVGLLAPLGKPFPRDHLQKDL